MATTKDKGETTMKNGNGSSAHHPPMTGAAMVPSYVVDASSSGVYPADYEELVKQARKRWVAVLTWRGLLSADKAAQVSGGNVA